MRTVWLAIFCLIALAATLAASIGMLPPANADMPQAAASSALSDALRERFPTVGLFLPTKRETTATSTQSDTLTKADRLEPYDATSIASVTIEPADTEAKLSGEPERIKSWHWHDPLDKPKAMAAQNSAKRKPSKSIATRQRIERRDPM
jgi:hypothetical protein